VNEVRKDRIRGNSIIKNRAGGNALLIAEKIADCLREEKEPRLF
jgi:hypothetical protein